MGYDLATAWILAFFGTCATAVAVGFAVARVTSFETGLGVGLLLPGLVSLAFTSRFATAYRDVTRNPHRVRGVVVAVEDRPANAAGSVTTAVPVVGFTVDGVDYRIVGRFSSSRRVGDTTTVVYDPDDPHRAWFGNPKTLRGGTVASMLFGTFPTSGGLFFVLDELLRRRRERPHEAGRPRWMTRLGKPLVTAGAVLAFGGILWMAVTHAAVETLLLQGFAIESFGLWTLCVAGILVGAEARWWLGAGAVAVNFTVWVAALWLIHFAAPG